MNVITHIAGRFEDKVQRCVRCGLILFDYRHANLGIGEDPPGYEEGIEVCIRTVPYLGPEPPPMCEFRRKVPA